MRKFLEVILSVNETQRNLLLPTLIELGCHGFLENDDTLHCYLDTTSFTDSRYEELKLQFKELLQTISSNISIQFRTIEEENWNKQWESSIQPIEIGKKFVIKPSWTNYNNPSNRIVIQIDPKMSFGTGFHETTRLVINLLEKYIKIGNSVLDVGTGTGILAIASVKLGASHAIGIDIDEWAIENAKENVQVNDVAELITILDKPLTFFPTESFDVITANLTFNTILEMLNEFRRILKSKGIVLLSGLLLQDKEKMVHHAKEHSFSLLETITENDWIALAIQKI